jgi:hypothetical protein
MTVTPPPEKSGQDVRRGEQASVAARMNVKGRRERDFVS